MLQERLPQVRIQLEDNALCLYGLQTRRDQREIEIQVRTRLKDSEVLRSGQRAEVIILEEGNVSYGIAEVVSYQSKLTLALHSPLRDVWRRTSKRVSHKLQAKMRGREGGGSDSGWLDVTTLDISAGGMRVYSRKDTLPSQIELRVWIPREEDPANCDLIQTNAEVVRRKPISLGGVEMGIRFDAMNADGAATLRAYLEAQK